MRLIDADRLSNKLHDHEFAMLCPLDGVDDVIDCCSTVDAVEVVRCGECKYNHNNQTKDKNDITDYSGDDIVCTYFMTDGMKRTDFCSYGERKE